MIYVEFDKYGVLNTIDLNEETIFKGSNRVNKIFVYFDGIELKPTHYLTYSALVNENDYDGDLTDLASVRTTYNGKDGYTFYLFSNLTAQAGSLKLSVRLVNRETEEILVSGILPLIVQDTAVSTYSNVNITTTQYNGLLVAIDEVAQTLNEINIEEINGLKDKVDEIETIVGDLETAHNNLFNAVVNLQEENRNQNDLINKHEKRIHTLELASEGNIIETIEEEATAYEYQLTANTLPYATIEKLGGMTYKSDNILIYDDIPETTINGLNYKVENGIVYLNGTLTTRSSIQINLKKPIGSGTYSYKNLGNGISDSDSRLIMYKLRSDGSTAFVDDLLQNATETLNLSQEADVVKFGIDPGTYTNATIKPMIVNGSTIPTTYTKGFEGLRNSAVNEVVVKGANLFNGNYLVGYFSGSTGQPSTNANYIRSDYIEVKGGNTIYFKKFTNTAYKIYVFQFDANKNVITQGGYTNESFNVNLNANCKYIGFNFNSGEIDSTTKLTIAYDVIEEYKPYKETTYTIPTSITSIDGYGIGIDETYYNYVDFANRKFVEHNKKIIFDGTQNIVFLSLNENYVEFKYEQNESFNPAPDSSGGLHIITNFTTQTTNDRIAVGAKTIYWRIPTHKQNLTGTTAESLKAYLTNNPVEIIYSLANPIETDLSYRITDDFIIEVEGGGTLVFENEHENAIPFAWTHQEKL